MRWRPGVVSFGLSFTVMLGLVIGAGEAWVWAQETASEAQQSPPKATSSPQRGGKRRGREKKEAEGTQAADRFQADPVVKSQYRYNGEPLEVDTD